MTVSSRVLIIVKDQPVPFDRRVRLECQTLPWESENSAGRCGPPVELPILLTP